MIKFFTIIISLTVILAACSSQVNSCIKPSMRNIEISWGEINAESKESTGFTMKSDLHIYESSLTDKSVDIMFSKIEEQTFCELVKNTRDSFIKIQSLHVPSKTSRYLVLKNNTTGITNTAIWNKLHENVGNKVFRALYEMFEDAREKSEKI